MMPVFLAGPAAKILALTLLVASIFGVGYYRGYAAEKQAWDAAIAEQAMKSASTVIKAAENTAQVVTRYIKVKGATETVFQTIEKEVPIYVRETQPCVIPVGVVRVLNDAISLSPSAGPSSGADDVPSRLTLTEFTGYVISIIEAAHQRGQQLMTLQEWVATSYEIQRKGAGQ